MNDPLQFELQYERIKIRQEISKCFNTSEEQKRKHAIYMKIRRVEIKEDIIKDLKEEFVWQGGKTVYLNKEELQERYKSHIQYIKKIRKDEEATKNVIQENKLPKDFAFPFISL